MRGIKNEREEKTDTFFICISIAIIAVLLFVMATFPVAGAIEDIAEKGDLELKREPLFSIDANAKLEVDLNKGVISEELKNAFEAEGFQLPENAAIRKEVPEIIKEVEVKKRATEAPAGDEWEIILKGEKCTVKEKEDKNICTIKKEGRKLNVYKRFRPVVISCDINGNEVDEFAPGEDVYVKGRRFWPPSKYKIWIQDDPVRRWEELKEDEDPSSSQEQITTNICGRFGPTPIWAIPPNEPITYHEYDIVVDWQLVGSGMYNPIWDGLDSATCAGIVAPVPDVSALALFASGLVLVSVYFVHGGSRHCHA